MTNTTPKRRNAITSQHETDTYINEPRVYARETKTKNIVGFLVGDASNSEDLSIYPILRIGRLGKKTLAQVIYNQESVVIFS